MEKNIGALCREFDLDEQQSDDLKYCLYKLREITKNLDEDHLKLFSSYNAVYFVKYLSEGETPEQIFNRIKAELLFRKI